MTGDGALDPTVGAEGSLLAHRRLIEALFAALVAQSSDGAAVVDAIERRVGVCDGQEDPGAVPDRAFAVERAAEAEIARTLRAIREQLEQQRGS